MCIASAYQGKRVLEIVLYGGLSPWETFWVPELDAGCEEGNSFTSYDTGSEVLVDMKGAESFVKDFAWCDFGSGLTPTAPPDPGVVKKFGVDEDGNTIYWGPATAPLWSEEILAHARMITFGHKDSPHELAMPIALTGQRIGDPRGAGLGAAITKAYRQSNECDVRPHAYVLTPAGFAAFRGITASIFATGSHGGANRPVELPVGGSGLGDLFLDSQPSDVKQAALKALRGQYQSRLRWAADGSEVPSPQFDDYRFSALGLENSSELHELLGDDILKAEYGITCAQVPDEEAEKYDGLNCTARALEVAATLLDPNQGDARYVAVMDRGFRTYGGAPYDTHTDTDQKDIHIPMTQGNLFNCLSHLRHQINLGKIDLDDTLVVLTTEMGRNPKFDETTRGRNHWPQGTVQILLGSPGESGIAGTMTPKENNQNPGGEAKTAGEGDSFHAYHARAAVLKAAGVNPVDPSIFQASELKKVLTDENGSYDEEKLSDLIGQRLLGLPGGA
jgi:hypothetical protein